MVTEGPGLLAELKCQVTRDNQGEVGLQLWVREGGSSLCGSQCKTSTHSSAHFTHQRPIKAKQAEPWALSAQREAEVHRQRAEEEAHHCETEMVEAYC